MNLVIGFSKPKSKWAIGSLLIRFIEKSDFSHAFLRWHSNGINRDMVYQASRGMVHFIAGHRFDDSVATVKEYLLTLDDSQYKQVVQKCVDLAGIKYGTLALFGMGFERLTGIRNPFRDADRTFVCSELVGEVLKVLGFNIDIDLEVAGPKELEDLVSKLPNVLKLK
jgi:hypothetical protein